MAKTTTYQEPHYDNLSEEIKVGDLVNFARGGGYGSSSFSLDFGVVTGLTNSFVKVDTVEFAVTFNGEKTVVKPENFMSRRVEPSKTVVIPNPELRWFISDEVLAYRD